ncbi:alternative ribosome rescue aminoacyl-tRNA hydrolase ArfB [Mesoterricola sediminis]|uniref:Peptidyl-tRNA hydrolase n=1 Tax=Mesoterricola sediminis TaxID=2927980 RepID=A0AA48GRW0_9BACT|nr:alternative ribosome rescue aminoacyl-tRNA hydrolase ArfB [Mesoterricola sediminis]BDU76479.1 peptidyl-tRNA hydrolase [Mesoterricola sediminis]
MDALQVTAAVTVPAQAFQVKAVRAGGPGGQNVNKVASKVELRVDLDLIEGLDAGSLERLKAKVANQTDADGRWIVTSSRTRDQITNLEDARTKVAHAIEAALRAPVPRRATRPTRSSKARRVDGKKRDGAVKKARSRKDWD